jgi:hypothetical protein
MNEIILAPCDAGYVQSCTGYIIIGHRSNKNNTPFTKNRRENCHDAKKVHAIYL